MLLTKLRRLTGLFVLAVAAGLGVTGCFVSANLGAGQNVQGSGKLVTQELKLADFTSVDVTSVFHVDVTQGKEFRVAITTDDNVTSHIKVQKDGSALKVGLQEGAPNFQNVTLKAAITMPTLEGLSVSGAGKATVTGFKSDKGCKLRVSGASQLKGDLGTGNLDLEATGASNATLKGSAKTGRITAEGASHLDLADFTVDKADVVLTGASSAKVQVKGELDYNVSGASQLKYGGNPKIGKQDATGAASAGKLQN